MYITFDKNNLFRDLLIAIFSIFSSIWWNKKAIKVALWNTKSLSKLLIQYHHNWEEQS